MKITLLALTFASATGFAAEPASHVARSLLCPFGAVDTAPLQRVALAESAVETVELKQAWAFYDELKGSWMPSAKKPSTKTVVAFDAFAKKVRNQKLPDWFIKATQDRRAQTFSLSIPASENDPNFKAEKETVQTEHIKALALTYFTEHELDRPNAAQTAAVFISILLTKTPWDWTAHSLYGRFLLDAGSPVALQEACLAIYLNPSPTKSDLMFSSFVVAKCAPDRFPDLEQMVRELEPDAKTADEVVREIRPWFTSAATWQNVPKKRP